MLTGHVSFANNSVFKALSFGLEFCITKLVSFVFQVAKKFMSGKKTMASSGQLVNTPFVDEI